MSNPEKEEGLQRVIGAGTLSINVVNLTVGAGIFALPAIVASQLGSAAFWAYFLCTGLLSLVLLCFIEVGSKVTASGGIYAYVEEAFGPLAGFLANSIFWLGFMALSSAAISNIMVESLATLFPVLGSAVLSVMIIGLIYTGLAGINILGTRESSRFVIVITLIKILPLLLLIVFGVAHVKIDHLRVVSSPSITSISETALILFFAFGGGAESALSVSGELKDPRRTVPRGLLMGVFFVLVIYMGIQGVAQGVLGEGLAQHREAPLAAVAEVIWGPVGGLLLIGAVALSCFGLLSSDMLVTPRIPFAAAQDGLLPEFLSRLHPKFNTPYLAIIAYAIICFGIAISGTFRQLAILSSASLLVVYVGVIAATIRLRHRKVEGAYTNPGGVIIPVLALLATGWFLYQLQRTEILGAVLFIVIFTGLYAVQKYRKVG